MISTSGGEEFNYIAAYYHASTPGRLSARAKIEAKIALGPVRNFSMY